ncbi:MAG: SPOR domain-containing protein [Luteibaculum sp.]
MRLIIFILPLSLLTLLDNTCKGQSYQNTNEPKRYNIDEITGSKPLYQGPGQINLIVEPGVQDLMDRYIENKTANPFMDGYRVQLYFGTREAATDAKTEFLKKFPGVKSYISYLQPNFRLRVGNFRSQHEAESFLIRVKKHFPSAYTVEDKIELPELN